MFLIVPFSIRNSKLVSLKPLRNYMLNVALPHWNAVCQQTWWHPFLLAFLGVQPLCKKQVFKTAVTEQIANRKEAGLATIRTTMVYIALDARNEVESTIKLVSKDLQYRFITFRKETTKQSMTCSSLLLKRFSRPIKFRRRGCQQLYGVAWTFASGSSGMLSWRTRAHRRSRERD
jgi:hypothetical protein